MANNSSLRYNIFAMKRGSVIIIAMLIVSAVGGIAFSFSRVLFLEILASRSFVNGIGAYYAAESGIEEGFLRLRFDKESEIPTEQNTEALRTDLSLNKRINNNKGILKASDSGIEPANEVYDLSVSSKSDIFGQDADKNGNILPQEDIGAYKKLSDVGSDYLIKRDDSKKFSLKNLEDGSDITFWFRPMTDNSTLPRPFNNKRCVLLETKIVGKRVGDSKTQEKKLLLYSNDPACDYSGVTKSQSLKDLTNQSYTIPLNDVVKISSIKNRIWPTVKIVDAYLFIKPIGSDIAIAFERNNPTDPPLFGPSIIVSSSGYFGGTARHLSASIDRQTGTLYDLFDYVIYEAS